MLVYVSKSRMSFYQLNLDHVLCNNGVYSSPRCGNNPLWSRFDSTRRTVRDENNELN